MHSKGLFFSIDAFIAITIIVIALFILFSVKETEQSQTQTLYFSQDLLNLLYETHIYEINDNEFPYLKKLKFDRDIRNYDNTFAEQLGEFYYRGDYTRAKNLVTDITKGIIPPQYNFDVVIDDGKLGGKKYLLGNADTAEYNASKQVVSSQRIVYGMLSSGEMWGPLKSEVWIWQVS